MTILDALKTRWRDGQCSATSLSLAYWWHRRLMKADADEATANTTALLVALLQLRFETGSTALSLEDIANTPFPVTDPDGPAAQDELAIPSQTACQEALTAAGKSLPHLIGDDAAATLITEGDCLAFSRHRRAEAHILAVLCAGSHAAMPLPEAACKRIAELFAEDPITLPQAWQRVAVAQIVRARLRKNRLCMLTGGPGTGKTTTVLRLLATLLTSEADLRAQLIAPTGKAADRLAQSIRKGLAFLPLSIKNDLTNCLPHTGDGSLTASTTHALLGSNPATGSVRHHAENPIDADVVVCDEASMLDPLLLAALIDALRPDTLLILVGDPDQLPSVGAGCVLADLVHHCHAKRGSGLDAALVKDLADLGIALPVDPAVTPLRSLVGTLQHSHRAAGQQGLMDLAAAIREGDSDKALTICHSDPACSLHKPDTAEVQQLVIAHAHEVLKASDPYMALNKLSALQLLCATRRGPHGADTLAEQVDRHLAAQSDRTKAGWYPGRPVLIGVNDTERGFRNGDIGICWLDEDDELRVHFPSGHSHLPADLPEHRCAWALTIHKSQGSEYTHPLVLLPPQADHPLVLRELLFTGVTRASNQVTIHASTEVFTEAIKRPTQRDSWISLQTSPPSVLK